MSIKEQAIEMGVSYAAVWEHTTKKGRYYKKCVLVDVSMMYAEPIILVLSLFIMVPLSYGMLSWYMSLAQDRAGGVTQIFSWFESGKKYGKSILIQINTFLRTILYLIPLYLLIVLMVVVLVFAGVLTYDMYSYYNPVTETAITALVILFSLLITACAILLGIFLLRYNHRFFRDRSKYATTSKPVSYTHLIGAYEKTNRP